MQAAVRMAKERWAFVLAKMAATKAQAAVGFVHTPALCPVPLLPVPDPVPAAAGLKCDPATRCSVVRVDPALPPRAPTAPGGGCALGGWEERPGGGFL